MRRHTGVRNHRKCGLSGRKSDFWVDLWATWSDFEIFNRISNDSLISNFSLEKTRLETHPCEKSCRFFQVVSSFPPGVIVCAPVWSESVLEPFKSFLLLNESINNSNGENPTRIREERVRNSLFFLCVFSTDPIFDWCLWSFDPIGTISTGDSRIHRVGTFEYLVVGSEA